ncbi:MAG: apolipoprotein N-acyltransferase [Rikenellaceae bacterium]
MTKKETLILWAMALFSSVLLSVPFLIPHTGLLMLVAFIPLFQLEKQLSDKSVKKGWIYYYAVFLLWNLFTTFWIYNATLPGAIAAIVLNALQMTLIFAAFRWFKRKTKPALGYLFLVLGWLAWEHFYFDAEISWPWLVLGNAFATSVKNIQWYEFTGTLGGSLWILLSNLVLFYILNSLSRIDKGVKIIIALYVLLIAAPIGISQYIYHNYKEVSNPKEFVVLQPNIDPYKDKFAGMTQAQQDEALLSIVSDAVTDSTALIIAPETFTSGLIENNPYGNETFMRLYSFLKQKKTGNILFGATSYYIYPGTIADNPPTYTAKKNGDSWYDYYNAAIFLDSTGKYSFYHKSKLVVLVEYLPYPQYLKFMKSLSIDLGGTSGSCGTQEERTVFESIDKSVKIGAAICYESIYGEYYRDYILNGANIMAIITNDGWWGNTPGYSQHLRYASLRAVETRRSIVRSANTGISALINQRGDVVQKTEWWKKGYLRGNLNLNNEITTFVKYGDFIGRVAYASMLLFIGLAILVVLKISGKVRQ